MKVHRAQLKLAGQRKEVVVYLAGKASAENYLRSDQALAREVEAARPAALGLPPTPPPAPAAEQ